ncbi:MAG: 50S ribosomal protein L17, partial [Gemmatimonadetes bacterium]|nr:50S ribosomal protein L17 [Gemmatimonadota bacterium]
MRHRVSGRKLDRPSALRRATYRGMVTDLLRHGRITTTAARAKEVRTLAERMVTHGKKGTVHNRRMAARFITDS